MSITPPHATQSGSNSASNLKTGSSSAYSSPIKSNTIALLVLRIILIAICIVASLTGANIILFGIEGIPKEGLAVQTSVDNELRFMSVFWVAFGFYALSLTKDLINKQRAVYALAFVFFLSGLARLLSFIQVGQPIPLFIGVMVLELVLPFIMMALLIKLPNPAQ